MSAEVIATLRAARELIAKPEAWTKVFFARDATGKQAQANSPRAVCWCIFGALERAAIDIHASDEAHNAAAEELDKQLRAQGSPSPTVVDFNDTCTHAEVLALFDATIARLEAEAKS